LAKATPTRQRTQRGSASKRKGRAQPANTPAAAPWARPMPSAAPRTQARRPRSHRSPPGCSVPRRSDQGDRRNHIPPPQPRVRRRHPAPRADPAQKPATTTPRTTQAHRSTSPPLPEHLTKPGDAAEHAPSSHRSTSAPQATAQPPSRRSAARAAGPSGRRRPRAAI